MVTGRYSIKDNQPDNQKARTKINLFNSAINRTIWPMRVFELKRLWMVLGCMQVSFRSIPIHNATKHIAHMVCASTCTLDRLVRTHEYKSPRCVSGATDLQLTHVVPVSRANRGCRRVKSRELCTNITHWDESKIGHLTKRA